MAAITGGKLGSRLKSPAYREAVTFYFTISPWIIGFLLFTAGPMIASLWFSMTDWNFISSSSFVGLQNYGKLLADPLFTKSLLNTAYYTLLSVPLGLLGGLLIALLMNQNLPGMTIFRTIYYLPAVVSGVAVAMLWKWIFDPNFGVLNQALLLFGIKGPTWIYSTTWVIPSFVIMSLWGVGGAMIIYLAGLQGVPTELYEAAELDGAGNVRKFWNITIPMISPVIFYNLIMGIIGSFQIFTSSLIMTDGGPNNASLYYVLYLYRTAFKYFTAGYASALAWVLFLIVILLTLLTFRSSALWVYYEGSVKK